MYPNLAGQRAVKPKFRCEEEKSKPTELQIALQPSYQRLFYQTMFPESTNVNEERALDAKYSVHAALAMQ